MGDTSLIEHISTSFGIKIKTAIRLSGGDIAEAMQLKTEKGDLFAKVLKGENAFKMLDAEKEGLLAIGRLNCLPAPEVLACSRIPNGAVLLLEYLKPDSPPGDFGSFGRDLACMHNQQQPGFGWARPNFIGSLPQPNNPHPDWASFYVFERLLPQYQLAVKKGLFQNAWVAEADILLDAIANMTPEVQPSLLHGDLWGGNYQYSGGRFFLIDPAVYCGHAEVDLAMSRLFGGFPESFYRGYYSLRPQKHGWEKRQQLYQLYYLLVYLNLFGTGYLSAVRQSSRELFSIG
ncbi:fructosamine kinase family protein [Robiginitalea sp. IMCC44478]|uniref:fructosamine kinase family protein n=1 Tax=Robiginitalea sp. IMCC44478 TaxID=3459122 RepID=UPI0040422DAD